ncbi:MAG: polysaccharide deacetylase family protein [Vicinamibacterales bacterium]
MSIDSRSGIASPNPHAKARFPPGRTLAHFALFGLLAFSAGAVRSPVQAAVTVAKHQWNVPGAFVFTFDDALPSHLIYAAPLLNQVGLKGSFYLTVMKVGDGPPDSAAIGQPTSTSWSGWKVLADSGHEIGSHTMTHPRLTGLSAEQVSKELQESAAKIKEKLGITPVTLAYPFNAKNPAVTALMRETYIAAREFQVGYGAEGGPDFAVTAAAMNKFVDDAIAGNKLQIGMIHGLTEPYAPTDPVAFLEHLKYCRQLVDQKQLWVPTFAAYSKYTIGRDSVRITELPSARPRTLEFRAESPLDPRLYDVPLTFMYKIPGAKADSVKVVRGNAPVNFRYDGDLVLVEALPGPEPIKITW